MDVERTMEFILEQQARNQAMLAEVIAAGQKTDLRLDRLEASVARQERNLARLARLGLKARSKINGRLDDHDRWFAEQKLLMHEMGEKLNAMINYVDRLPRTSPQS